MCTCNTRLSQGCRYVGVGDALEGQALWTLGQDEQPEGVGRGQVGGSQSLQKALVGDREDVAKISGASDASLKVRYADTV